MHVVIEHPPDSDDEYINEDADARDRTEFFGVQDCIVDDAETVTLFWPYHSALADYETQVAGRITAATEESILNLDTYVDYIADGTYVKNTVVVPTPEYYQLSRALEHVPDDFRHELTVIEPDDDVDLDDYEFFTK